MDTLVYGLLTKEIKETIEAKAFLAYLVVIQIMSI